FSLEVLLEASTHLDPLPDPPHDSRFDDFPSWSPATRIEATEGLVSLARHLDCATRDLLEAIQRLSRDLVPAVRFPVARNIQTLYRTAPEVMWQIIEHMSHEEPSRGV